MNVRTAPAPVPGYAPSTVVSTPPGKIPSRAQCVFRMLDKLETGALQVNLPGGQVLLFGKHGQAEAGTHGASGGAGHVGARGIAGIPGITLRNWKVCAAVLKSGDIGFAETFIAGDWHTDDLPGLIELFVHNRKAVETAIYGTWWGNLYYRCKHLLHRNSKHGSRKNIHAHYDIGNDFYRLWLDAGMTYSSGIFPDTRQPASGSLDTTAQPAAAVAHAATDAALLAQAQEAKYRRVLDQLALAPDASVLEIGCGWGGFAQSAARAGAHVTGLTLSREQLAFAQQRMAQEGLTGNTQLKLCDYRDVDGSYDAIASIEMFEAVGEQYWPAYFDCVARNLKPGGKACIQSITIADALYDRYRKGTDFIQQYIFPGGMLPSPAAFRRQAERHGLRVVDEFSFGADYARTLRIWRDNFKAQLHRVLMLKFDYRFIRTWEFYLAYCEAGFHAGSLNVMQFTLQKPVAGDSA